MNAFPSLAVWLEPVIVLALGAAVVVGLASIASHGTRSGPGRRAIWQAALAALAVLFVAEVTGLSSGVLDAMKGGAARSSDAFADLTAAPSPATPAAASHPQVNRPKDDVEEDDAASPPEDSDEPSIAWWPGLVWLAGAVLVGGRACVARLLLILYRARRRRCADAELTALVGVVAGRLGYRRSVGIVEAEGLLAPAAFGIVRPTLALPAGFRTLFSPTQQEAIVAHELAHLAAHDPAWHFFAQLVTAALWWHPLAWWALSQFRAATESAADEASLVVADGPGVLATCLVQLGTRLAQRRSAGWLSMAGSGFRSGLGQRVERLLRLEGAAWRPFGRVRRVAILILGPALLTAAAGLITAWARSPATDEGDVPMTSAWKRSLAAVALVAALGSADPAPGGQQTGQSGPPTGGQTRPAKDIKTLDDKEDADCAQQRDVAAELFSLIGQVKARDEDLRRAKDADVQKMREELQVLNAKVKELEAQRKRLEAELAKLEDKKAEAATAAKPTTRIKVFRLKHRDPNELAAVLTELLPHGQPAMSMMDAMGGKGSGMMGGKGGFGGMMGGGGGGKGGFGGMMPGGAGAGGGGFAGGRAGAAGGQGGLMGMAGGGGMAVSMGGGLGRPATSWRIVADARTNSLIVRGTEEDFRAIGDLIAALDVADNKTATKLKNLRTFKLKHADVGQVSAILQELELKVTVSVLPSANLLAVSGPESALKEVAELIEELDVDGKPVKDVKPRQ